MGELALEERGADEVAPRVCCSAGVLAVFGVWAQDANSGAGEGFDGSPKRGCDGISEGFAESLDILDARFRFKALGSEAVTQEKEPSGGEVGLVFDGLMTLRA